MKPLRKRLIDRLDKIVSIYVRTIYSKNGYCRCYTCEAKGLIKEMDCGHFVKRGYMNTRWDLDNLRVQCTRCNRFLDGNQDEFIARLSLEMGRDMGIELNKKKHTIKQWSIKELEELEIKFKTLYNSIQA
jgi:Bacteriophage Lambda NinG protein.